MRFELIALAIAVLNKVGSDSTLPFLGGSVTSEDQADNIELTGVDDYGDSLGWVPIEGGVQSSMFVPGVDSSLFELSANKIGLNYTVGGENKTAEFNYDAVQAQFIATQSFVTTLPPESENPSKAPTTITLTPSSESPSASPIELTTTPSTTSPSEGPTEFITSTPSGGPSLRTTLDPTKSPTESPIVVIDPTTNAPIASYQPTLNPNGDITFVPSLNPTTEQPFPGPVFTFSPTTQKVTVAPTSKSEEGSKFPWEIVVGAVVGTAVAAYGTKKLVDYCRSQPAAAPANTNAGAVVNNDHTL